MSVRNSLRIFHRNIAPWLGILFVFTAVTGIAYRIGRSWFGMPKEVGWQILDLHTGEWLGKLGGTIYVVVIGLGLLAIIATGISNRVAFKPGYQPMRKLHSILALLACTPLIVSALTGMAYKVGEAWFQMKDETGELLMYFHQGSWLGPELRAIYVLFVGLGLVVVTLTGWRLAIRR